MSHSTSRLTRLETRSRRADVRIIEDDEVLEALRSDTYGTAHVDALFRVIEPGMLGTILMYADYKRRDFPALLGAWQAPCYPIEAAYWLVAAGDDVNLSEDYHLAQWETWFEEPINENPASRNKDWLIWDAQEGLVKRLFRKHGLANLRSIVKALSEASIEDRKILIDKFVPRSDEARRERMSRISAPLRPYIGWYSHPFPLIVLSPDADEFWYSGDNTGQQWTALRVR